MDIKHRFNRNLLFNFQTDSMRVCLGAAVKADADLTGAVLNGADLSWADLRRADLRRADLTGAVLNGAVLTGAVLNGADLNGAVLTGAVLTGAVLNGAVPVIENIDAAILAAIKHGGALDMGDWHTCETTHCRAGWAIMLAGDAGAALEAEFGPSVAGALIYAKSRPEKPVPNFFATNEEAMADMQST